MTIFLGDTDLDFPRFFRFFNDRLIVTEEFSCAVKIFVVEGIYNYQIQYYHCYIKSISLMKIDDSNEGVFIVSPL